MKKRLLLIVGLLSVLIPINLKALSGSVSISCSQTTLEVNNTTTCTLSGYSNEGVSAVSAKLTGSGSISVTDVVTNTIWQGNGVGGNIDLYTDNNKSGSFQIATFKVNAKSVGTGTINVNGIKFSDASFTEHAVTSKALSIIVKEKKVVTTTTQAPKPTTTKKAEVKQEETISSDATLKSITLSKGTINFSRNVTEYKVDVSNEIENISITAIANSNKAKVEVPETTKLKNGENKFSIKVIAEDGTEKIYTVIINRLDRELSGNTKLESLRVVAYPIEFDKDTLAYDLGDVKENTLKVIAKAEDENAKVEIYGSDSVGKDDAIIIKVTAENGKTSEYIIYANNIETQSSINVGFIVVTIISIISIIFNILFATKKIKIKG